MKYSLVNFHCVKLNVFILVQDTSPFLSPIAKTNYKEAMVTVISSLNNKLQYVASCGKTQFNTDSTIIHTHFSKMYHGLLLQRT